MQVIGNSLLVVGILLFIFRTSFIYLILAEFRMGVWRGIVHSLRLTRRKQLHLILEVTDDSDIVSLTDYRRMVITVSGSSD